MHYLGYPRMAGLSQRPEPPRLPLISGKRKELRTSKDIYLKSMVVADS